MIASGQRTVCTFTIKNLGPANTAGVTFSNPVPANAVLSGVTTSKGLILQTNQVVFCHIGTLTNGESATVSFVVLAINQGQVVNQAFVSADQYDPNPVNNSSTATFQVGQPLSISITDATVREGNGGFSPVAFTLSLSASNTVTASFRYQTADGTGIAGVDYNTNSGLFTLQPGPPTRILSLGSAIRANNTIQSNRFFYVNLSSPSNVTLIDTQAVVTIIDDDFRTITATNIALREGHSGQTNAVFNIRLSQASTSPVLVDYQTLAATAQSGSDFSARAGSLRFEPGATNLTLSVAVLGDILPEMDETFFMLFSQPLGAVLGTNQVRVLVSNDDVIPPLAWTRISRVDQEIHLSFPTISGRFYRVERTSDLSNPNWSVVLNNIAGTGQTVEVIDLGDDQITHASYRLVLLP